MSWDNLSKEQLHAMTKFALCQRSYIYALVLADQRKQGKVDATIDAAFGRIGEVMKERGLDFSDVVESVAELSPSAARKLAGLKEIE